MKQTDIYVQKQSLNQKLKRGPKATSAYAMDWKGTVEVLIAQVLLIQQSIPVEASTSRLCCTQSFCLLISEDVVTICGAVHS